MLRRAKAGWLVVSFLVLAQLAVPAEAAGGSDPLPSWRSGPAKTAILRFVADVTQVGGPRFVPKAERIATFDNDGTLMAEKPAYFQLYFFMQRLRELAPQHPEWKEKQPFKAVLEDDRLYLHQITLPELEELVLAASAGSTEKEYQASIDHFLENAEHPLFEVPFTELVYQPMLELLELLRRNGFQIYITTAGGPELIRAFSEEVFRIPRPNVIGSDMQMRFEMEGEEPILVREPRFVRPTNERKGKPVNIERVVGRSPIFAFGNSDGDTEMLEFTAYSGRPHLALVLHHDDHEREFAYDEGAEKVLALAKERGWIVVNMSESFRRVFPRPKPR